MNYNRIKPPESITDLEFVNFINTFQSKYETQVLGITIQVGTVNTAVPKSWGSTIADFLFSPKYDSALDLFKSKNIK